jgi:hypothetical protein
MKHPLSLDLALGCAFLFFAGCTSPAKHAMLPLGNGKNIRDVYAPDEGPALVQLRVAASVASDFVRRKWNLASPPKPLRMQMSGPNSCDVLFSPLTKTAKEFVVRVDTKSWCAVVLKKQDAGALAPSTAR